MEIIGINDTFKNIKKSSKVGRSREKSGKNWKHNKANNLEKLENSCGKNVGGRVGTLANLNMETSSNMLEKMKAYEPADRVWKK